jgi:ParB/RepB/Spo0J family partition protein
MIIQQIAIEKLKPFEENPRVNTKAVEAVKKSIVSNGFNQPIVCNQDFIICVGHTRWLAAKEIGLKEVPVYVKHMGKSEFVSYNIADNKTSELSEWDNDLLSKLMKELNENDYDLLTSTGFSEDEIEALLDTGDIKDLIEEDDKDHKAPSQQVEKSHVKMVQIFLDDITFPKFIEMAEVVKNYVTTDNLTDTIYNCVEKVYDEVKNKG